jgi:site-specific DNA-methyltransferase (adenine-specific)
MIEEINIKLVIPHPNNPRLIKDDKFKKLVQSIKDFPEMLQLRPIVVDDNMIVLGGNMRLRACIEAGLKRVPIIKASALTAEQQKRFIITDNVGFGEWDWDMLANEWDQDELIDWGLDLPVMDIVDAGTADEDDYDAPEGGLETDIVLGDLFEIGPHRLLCGDSTNLNDVEKLLNNEKADLLFTDPPYNVSFNGRSGKFDVIENDNLDTDTFDKFIEEFAQTVHSLQIPIKYIWCNWKFYGTLQKHFTLNACIVWAKNVFGLGRGYRHQHEFCFFEGKLDDGINNESDLWEIKKDHNYVHPTQKPIALSERALNNHKKANIILDLFGGSGSTMVGCHQLKRKARLMELDPKYCQVIIDRMKKLDPSLVIKKNGEIYESKK